jgi:hypothetical protein
MITFKDYLLEDLVSFDYQGTLIKNNDINKEVINILKNEVQKGNKAIIVSTSLENEKSKIEQFLKKYNLPISQIYCTNGEDKVFTLKELGVNRHYDDNNFELMMLKNSGIQGILIK